MAHAIETHWAITITQGSEHTHVACDCGWSLDIDGNGARSITAARNAWDAHNCGGRPLTHDLRHDAGAVSS